VTGEETTFDYVVNPDGTRVTTTTIPPTSFEPGFEPTLEDHYTADGWLTSRVSRPSSADTLTETYTYTAEGFRASVTNPRGQRTDVCYDTTYAGGPLADSRGNPTRIIGPAPTAGADRPVTLMAYDAADNLVQTVAPMGVPSGSTVTCATDLSAIDPAHAGDRTYDASGTKLLSTTTRFSDPDYGLRTAVTRLEYGDATNPGLVTRSIPARGNTGGSPEYAYATTFAYFGSGPREGLLRQVTDPLGNVTSYEHDAIGRLIATVDPLGHEPGASSADHRTDIVYDREDRVRFVLRPAPTTGGERLISETRYDAAGNPVVRIDPAGQVTTLAYDGRNLLTELLESPSTWTDPGDPPSDVITTHYDHDAAGNATRVIRAAGDATFERRGRPGPAGGRLRGDRVRDDDAVLRHSVGPDRRRCPHLPRRGWPVARPQLRGAG
jgi:YD repeat-containing protein